MNDNTSIQAGLQAFAAASYRFSSQMDLWVRRFGGDHGDSGSWRITLLMHRSDLRRLAGASRSGKSIGFYGESQCGKSNLVSRVGQGLGVMATKSGSLLIDDRAVDGPWRKDGCGGIEFATWLNPTSNRESTGIVCRFSRSGPKPEKPGCFVASVVTHDDLVMSLALGCLDDIESQQGVAADAELRRAMDEFQSCTLEPDPEDFMAHLMGAWRFLLEQRPGHPRLVALAAAGWCERAHAWFIAGKRPVWNRKDRASPYQRFAGLLWGNEREVDDVYRLVLGGLLDLAGATEISIPIVDVCGSGPDATVPRPSLLDIGLIDRLFIDEASGTDGVEVHFRNQRGDSRTISLPRSWLVALIRELVLPVAGAENAPTNAAEIDILDYPGARTVNPSERFSTHQDPRRLALQIFRRGKLNRLFLSGVELHDCSALCLVVSGQGNLEAGSVVRAALRSWLNREEWSSAATQAAESFDFDGAPELIDPALVVAVTKADQLLRDGGQPLTLFGGRLDEIQNKYCSNLDWLFRWGPGGAFRRVHWVHNPDVPGVIKPHQLPAAAQIRVRAAYGSDAYVVRFVEEASHKLDALLANPPQDVDELFKVLRRVTDPIDRELRVSSGIVDILELLVAATERYYVGPNDKGRIERERTAAHLDVKALRSALNRGLNPVSELLRALQMTSVDVDRASRHASSESASVAPTEVGVVTFDDFYSALRQRFAAQLDRDLMNQKSRWINFLRDGPDADSRRLPSIVEHFREIPGSDWFRERIESRVGAMIRQQNTAALSTSVLGAITSSVWNRSIVGLDVIPEAPDVMVPVPPPLREAHAASAKILDHWEQRLPEVYVKIVDPNNARKPGNAEMGKLREQLRTAIDEFMRASKVSNLTPSLRRSALDTRLANLRAALSDGEVDAVASV
jgi:hypothetical protein